MWPMAPPLPLDFYKPCSEKHISPFYKLLIRRWHSTWHALTSHYFLIVNKVRTQDAKPWPRPSPLPWHNVWGCFNYAGAAPDDPTKYSYWQRVEFPIYIWKERQLSMWTPETTVSRGAELWQRGLSPPGGCADPPWWVVADFVTPQVAVGPQKSSHRNHPCSEVTWPPATAADPVLCTQW